MLILNKDGVIATVEEQLIWCIFNYKSDEDPTNIIGCGPLTYNSYDELMKEWDSCLVTDRKEWKESGYKTVIRPIKILR